MSYSRFGADGSSVYVYLDVGTVHTMLHGRKR